MRKLRKIMCLFVISLFIFNSGLFPIMYSVYAVDGASGNYTYKLESDGNVTITGYSGQEKNITIPKTLDGKNVTQIGDSAFASKTFIQSVKILENIKRIDFNAFKDCTGIETVELQEGLEIIGVGAFENCTKIKTIYIPKTLDKGLTRWGYEGRGPFKNCSSLNDIKFAEGITQIPEGIFSNCTGLTKITIPATVEKIENGSFFECKNLKEVNIGNKVTEIEDESFRRCSGLKNVKIPKSVKKIGFNAFMECSELETVELQEGLETIGVGAFENCTKIKTIYIPKTLDKSSTRWGYEARGAFKNCSSLNDIKFAEGITQIPEGIFSNCTGLTKITIPATVEKIENGSFFECKNLKEVNIGNKVTEIEDESFRRCSGLKNVKIPKSVKKIGFNAFMECSELETVELQEGLETIGVGAFENCTKIKTIYIPKTLDKSSTRWGYEARGAFKNCSSLNDIKFAEGITQIPEGIFSNCTGLTKITIPSTVEKIENASFFECKNLKEVNIGNKVTEIEDESFRRCSGLKNIKIPKNVKKIGFNAFMECSELETVELQEGLEILGIGAFANCTKIKSIYIPKTLNQITTRWGYEGRGPFKDCINLKNINFGNGTTKINDGLFCDCTGIEDIIIPDTVTEIGELSFANCSNLETVQIPKNVTKCKNTAFKNTNTVVFCDKYSDTIKTLIDQDCNIQILSEKYEDSEEKAIIKDKSEYLINVDSSANGYIPVKITYSIKHNIFDEITDKKINVRIPTGMEIHIAGIYLDSTLISNYNIDYNKNILSIPIENQTGTITFNLNAIESAKLRSYVEISYKKNNKKYADLVDVIVENKSPITISAPAESNTGLVKVSGTGPKGKNVTISAEGQKDITVKTSKITGRYSAEVKINDSINYYETDITAKAQSEDGEDIFSTTTVRFNERTPEIKSFIMNYSNHSKQTIDLIEYQNSRKTLTYLPSYAPSFELEFENADKIDKVYVVSTRNGVKKSLEATYNSASKKYYASGFFDEENTKTYVPSVISYEYTLKKDESINQANLPVEDTIIYKAAKDAIESEKIKVQNSENKESAKSVESILDNANIKHGKISVQQFDIQYAADKLVEVTGGQVFRTAKFEKAIMENVEDWTDAANELGLGLEVISTTSNIIKYTTKDGKLHFNVDFSDPYSVTSFVYDVTSNKLIKYTIGATENGAKLPIATFSNKVNSISPLFKIAKNYYALDYKRNDMEKKILASNMTEEEKQTALECARRLDIVRRIDFQFGSMFAIAGMADKETFGIISAAHDFIFDSMFYIGEKAILGEYPGISDAIAKVIIGATRITGTTFLLKWIIDPSGYVYEAVPTNKLEGVKCTIYYKEKEDSTPIIWNAKEYEQENPIYSDEEGKYAWDVPEGLWQVKYEKAGYETKKSEWLPVPPPQTDINIPLISKQKPKVTNINIYNSYIEIEFDKYMDISTLNNKAISIKDKNKKSIDFTIEFANKTLDENGKYIASKIVLKPKTTLNVKEKYTIEINSNAKSYSDIAMDKYTNVTQATKEPNIKCDENISLKLNEEKNVTITVENIDSGTLKCTSSDGTITIKQNDVKINKGKATISIQGIAKGSSIITLQVQGTDILKEIYVTCDNATEKGKISLQDEFINIGVGETYKLKPILYPTSLEQKFTFKSYNKDIASVNEKGEIKGLKEGKAQIVIQTTDGSISTSIEVQVIKAKTSYTKGDINEDGKINARDAKMALQYYTKKIKLTESQKQAADVNNDTKVNARDAKLILQYYTKKIKEF